MLGLIQFLLLCSLAAFAWASVAFLVFGLKYAFLRQDRRGLFVTGFFIGGALASGFVTWQLVPSEWTLPFWTTVKATVDSETYGHAVEHYAEGVVIMLTFAAVLGGGVSAAVTAFCTRPTRPR